MSIALDNFKVIGVLFAAALLFACGQNDERSEGENSVGDLQGALTELSIKDILVGDGDEAVQGQTAVMHYTGWLYEPTAPDLRGKKFDSSLDRNQPFPFILGTGQVIRGWDEGVAGMKVGGKRELIIPPDMAYGSRGAGGVIPPDATLLFEVELLGVQ
ncbi:MAG: FKBP-type peptidyl-prolyl cis-trans isomerase [Gammaproteobacteria bacterium]|nr:FKBP-type peptidyl-prolyl cis-trans isomerase [Gammaproteobacteria bacterium]